MLNEDEKSPVTEKAPQAEVPAEGVTSPRAGCTSPESNQSSHQTPKQK